MFTIITNWLEPFSYLLFFIANIFIFNKSSVKSMALFYYSGIATVLMCAASGCVAFQLTTNNIFFYYLFEIATSFVLIVIIKNISINKTIKKLLFFILLLNAFYSIYLLAIFSSISLFNSLGAVVISFCVMVMTLFYFIQKFKKVELTKIYHTLDFWVIVRFFFLHCTNFFILLYYYYLTKKIYPNGSYNDAVIVTNLWGLHNIVLFISSLIYMQSLWILYQKKLHY